jgi:geranylgeranyl pyrophosphate synthase
VANVLTSAIVANDTIKADVDRVLSDFCDRQLSLAAMQGIYYTDFWQSIRNLLEAGGKRMRPYLCVLAYRMYGGQNYEGILSVAAAQELLHLSMLIHDDIIDRDDVRYGVPNISGQYMAVYGGRASLADVKHYALSAALLAGDAVLSSAYEIILSGSLQDAEKIQAMRLIADSVQAVVGGELADTESVMLPVTSSDPVGVATYKTAMYSFVGPLLSGAGLAHAPELDLEQLRAYGLSLGVAFQLADDLLGIFGDEEVTGKSVISDIEEGKRTYLLQQAYVLCNETQRAELDMLVGHSDITTEDALRVRNLITNCGARDRTVECISDHAAQASQALQQLSTPESVREPLQRLIAAATKRNK